MLRRPDVYLLIIAGLVLWMIAAFVINWRVSAIYQGIEERMAKHDELGAHPIMHERATVLELRVDSLETVVNELRAKMGGE